MKLILQVGFLSLSLFFGSIGYSESECDAVVEGATKTLEDRVMAAAKAKAQAEIDSKFWNGAWIPKITGANILDVISSRKIQYWLVAVTMVHPRFSRQTNTNYIVRRPVNNPDAEFSVDRDSPY